MVAYAIMTHMKRLSIYLTDEQWQELSRRAQGGKTVAELVRSALDWHLAITGYADETLAKLQEIHPAMTPLQLVVWLAFRWRVDYEGKSHHNGNGQVIALLEEILSILKGGQHDTDNG